MTSLAHKLCNVPLSCHLLFAFVIRVVLIIYGEIHDKVSVVPYTDIDYKVFTDAARYVCGEKSPYLRHTYRYTPLLAILLTPNIFLHQTFGKFLFSVIDLLVAVLIKKIIIQNSHKDNANDNSYDKTANIGAMLWLYNPLAVVIATRGNADSISAFLVLAALYFLQIRQKLLGQYVMAGILHGVAIHFRLYPLAFSLPMYLTLSEYDNWKNLIPNTKQILLAFSCIATILFLTLLFYELYGDDFLHESYLYHLIRRDTRHNFSVYFYLLYLSADINTGIWQKLLTFFPQMVLLLVLSFHYGKNMKHLNFCLLCQAVIMVAYNPVVTSQYFVWFLSLLPLSVKDLNLTIRSYVGLGLVWTVAQMAWLFPAFLLEFKGQEVFLFVWLQGIAFFCAQMFILARFIKSYLV